MENPKEREWNSEGGMSPAATVAAATAAEPAAAVEEEGSSQLIPFSFFLSGLVLVLFYPLIFP